jgi:hypothetical protein
MKLLVAGRRVRLLGAAKRRQVLKRDQPLLVRGQFHNEPLRRERLNRPLAPTTKPHGQPPPQETCPSCCRTQRAPAAAPGESGSPQADQTAQSAPAPHPATPSPTPPGPPPRPATTPTPHHQQPQPAPDPPGAHEAPASTAQPPSPTAPSATNEPHPASPRPQATPPPPHCRERRATTNAASLQPPQTHSAHPASRIASASGRQTRFLMRADFSSDDSTASSSQPIRLSRLVPAGMTRD